MQLAVFRLWQRQLFNHKTFLFCTFFIWKITQHCLLCSESSPLFNSPLHWQKQHMARSMWRQTQQESIRRWVMFILHCILLVLRTGCFSTLPFLMRTICWITGEGSSALHLRHTNQRPLLLLPSHSVQMSQSARGVVEGAWHGSQEQFIFQSASALIEHCLWGMFGILIWKANPLWVSSLK